VIGGAVRTFSLIAYIVIRINGISILMFMLLLRPVKPYFYINIPLRIVCSNAPDKKKRVANTLNYWFTNSSCLIKSYKPYIIPL
jgi:hypothetical protein